MLLFDKAQSLVPVEKRNKTLVFIFILIGVTLDNINVAASFTISEDLQKQFNADSSIVTWVVSAYALTLGSFVIVFGKMADIVGPHVVFLYGLFFMALTSLINAVIRKQIIALIVFRALQGISGAAILPSGMSLTGNYFSGDQLKNAVKGLLLAITAILGIGTILGGAFSLTNVGYRGFYFLSFGMATISFVFLVFFIIPVEKTEDAGDVQVKDIDFTGAILLVSGLLVIILGLTFAGDGWNSPKVYVPIPVGFVVAMSAFLFETGYIRRYQKHHPEKDNWKSRLIILFPPETIQVPNFVPYITDMFFYFAGYTCFLTSVLKQHEFVDHNSPILAAVKVSTISLGVVTGSLIYQHNVALKIGLKNCLIASSLIVTGSAVWGSRMSHSTSNSFWKFEFVSFLLQGYGINLYFQVYYNAILSQTPRHLQGTITAIFQTVGQIGMCIGTAVGTSVIGSLELGSELNFQEVQHKIRNALYVSIAFYGVTVPVILLSRKVPSQMAQEEDESTDESTDKNSDENTDENIDEQVSKHISQPFNEV